MKASNYSTIFQIIHQTGTFNGIDTCSDASFVGLGFKYILSAESQVRSINNLPDINDLLIKLRQENIFSEYVDSMEQTFANHLSIKIDYLKYIKGATFVSLEASMILQDEMTNRQI